MSVAKVTEVNPPFEKGIEAAIQNTIDEVSKTVRSIDPAYTKDTKIHLKRRGNQFLGHHLQGVFPGGGSLGIRL